MYYLIKMWEYKYHPYRNWCKHAHVLSSSCLLLEVTGMIPYRNRMNVALFWKVERVPS